MRMLTAILVACATLVANQSDEAVQVWSLELDPSAENFEIVWAPNSACFAAVNDAELRVIDVGGRVLWHWPFLEENRFFKDRQFNRRMGPMAVSPHCDTVAIAGTSAYRYVWTGTRDGHRYFLKTIGTPHRIAFHPAGATIAVTTAGPHAYLLTPTLETQWSGRLSQFPITWPGAVRWTGRPEVEFPTQREVASLFGNVVMLHRSDAISDDGQWRVVWEHTFRRSHENHIELRGPIPNAYRSRRLRNEGPPRWKKAMSCPWAEITPDGRYVIARGELTFDSDEYCSDDLTTHVFDRDGRTVLVWKRDPRLESDVAAAQAFGDALFAKTGIRIPPPVTRGWDIPYTEEEIARPSGERPQFWSSPNGEMAVGGFKNRLRLVRRPSVNERAQ